MHYEYSKVQNSSLSSAMCKARLKCYVTVDRLSPCQVPNPLKLYVLVTSVRKLLNLAIFLCTIVCLLSTKVTIVLTLLSQKRRNFLCTETQTNTELIVYTSPQS